MPSDGPSKRNTAGCSGRLGPTRRSLVGLAHVCALDRVRAVRAGVGARAGVCERVHLCPCVRACVRVRVCKCCARVGAWGVCVQAPGVPRGVGTKSSSGTTSTCTCAQQCSACSPPCRSTAPRHRALACAPPRCWRSAACTPGRAHGASSKPKQSWRRCGRGELSPASPRRTSAKALSPCNRRRRRHASTAQHETEGGGACQISA